MKPTVCSLRLEVDGSRWLTPVILAMREAKIRRLEAKIRRIKVRNQPQANSS
jgi:hypothetical protein